MTEKSKSLLKVCKIDSLEFASFAIKQGVDYLGIHVLNEDQLGEHLELVAAIKKGGGKPIIVTKIQSLLALRSLVDLYRPYGIQLHFESDLNIVKSLRQTFPNLTIIGVFTNESKNLNFTEIDDAYNLIIYDTSYKGGTNTSSEYIYWIKFPNTLKKKTLLAGGINPKRIADLTEKDSAGFDIQSYFRDKTGLNYRNLEHIVDMLKFPRQGKISVSLTDVKLSELHKAASFSFYPHLEYHLDYSPGKLYPTFNTKSNSIDEKKHFLLSLPHSIHLFINNEIEITDNIRRLILKNSNTLVRIFIQYYAGMQVENLSMQKSDVKTIYSIYYKDLTSFMDDFPHCPSFISIIVPSRDNPINLDEFIKLFNKNKSYFENAEIWLDRNLDLDYIDHLLSKLDMRFNYIIGKEVIDNWNKINEIHEYLSKKK